MESGSQGQGDHLKGKDLSSGHADSALLRDLEFAFHGEIFRVSLGEWVCPLAQQWGQRCL